MAWFASTTSPSRLTTKHRVAQGRHERVSLGLLLRQREQAGLVLPTQTLGLAPGLLVAHQGLHDSEQVVGQERLGQKEVDSLAGGGDGGVDVGVGGDHAGHQLQTVLLDGLQDGQTIDIGQPVVEKRDVELAVLSSASASAPVPASSTS